MRATVYVFLDQCETLRSEPINPTKSLVDNVMDATKAVTHLDASNAPAWISGDPHIL